MTSGCDALRAASRPPLKASWVLMVQRLAVSYTHLTLPTIYSV